MDLRPATDTGTRMAGRVPRKRVRVSDRAPVFRSTWTASLVGRELQIEAIKFKCLPALIRRSLSAQGWEAEAGVVVGHALASHAFCSVQLEAEASGMHVAGRWQRSAASRGSCARGSLMLYHPAIALDHQEAVLGGSGC